MIWSACSHIYIYMKHTSTWSSAEFPLLVCRIYNSLSYSCINRTTEHVSIKNHSEHHKETWIIGIWRYNWKQFAVVGWQSIESNVRSQPSQSIHQLFAENECNQSGNNVSGRCSRCRWAFAQILLLGRTDLAFIGISTEPALSWDVHQTNCRRYIVESCQWTGQDCRNIFVRN